jgi:Ca2+-binding EF-hand superfamily protein
MEFDLKEVFSILDENGEGQIQLRRFIDVANNYYSDAEVSAFEFLIETTVQSVLLLKKYDTISSFRLKKILFHH